MSDTSHVLSLPLIQPSQAQKHITHNEALQILDAVVQLVVIASDQATPPQTPQTGDRYIVAPSGSGAWAGHEGDIAVYTGTNWIFITPLPGWSAQVLNPKGTALFDETQGWQNVTPTLETTPQLGINATADLTNRLSLSAPASLLNHEGAGHQLKVNKATASDTASLLFQNDFSGRAEMGLAGNDDFSVKVSPDGATWRNALQVDAQTARMIAPEGLESARVTAVHGSTLTITPPSPAGFAMISSVSPNFPQSAASMIICYDVGLSPQLIVVWHGGAIHNLGNTPPTAANVPAGKVALAAQSDGTLLIRNEYPSALDLDYCITWTNSWR
ncbi:DUF2793 domain-containing protein [Lentibacter sp.]|uniref:DUF2793 domain-containing protein n=1 Tax=Lentibacter sp. TaxID=2024994 RepID=UPI003F69699D